MRGPLFPAHAADRQLAAVFLDQHALAAAGVEHARGRRQRIEVAPHRGQLGNVGGVELPGGIERPMVVSAVGVFTAAYRHDPAHDIGVKYRFWGSARKYFPTITYRWRAK